MNEKMLIKNLYDLDKTIAKPLLETLDYPWEALPKIKDFITWYRYHFCKK